jgi:hypothetical protein
MNEFFPSYILSFPGLEELASEQNPSLSEKEKGNI